jgi:hypothetical protein
MGLDLAFYALRSLFVDKAADYESALDPLPGEVSDGVVGPGRLELAAAVGRRPLQCRAYSARTDRRCRSPKISIRSVIMVRTVRTNLAA